MVTSKFDQQEINQNYDSLFSEGGLWIVLTYAAFIYGAVALAVVAIVALALKGYRMLKGKDKSN